MGFSPLDIFISPPGAECVGIAIGIGGWPPGAAGAVIGIVMFLAVGACDTVLAFAAGLFFARFFVPAVFFAAGTFAVDFLGAGFFDGAFFVGIVIPGIFICSAMADEEKDASATALTANNKPIFMAGSPDGRRRR